MVGSAKRPEYSLKDLEPEHLTDFLESRQISGRTWNNYRRDFHVTFAWAVDQKHLLTNPAAAVPELEEDPINAQVLSPEEFSRLIKSAVEALQPVLALQGLAGLRQTRKKSRSEESKKGCASHRESDRS
jgi:hypothetical protein